MRYISPEGLEKLKKELSERKTIKRKEIAKRLEEAKALGDLSENAEYSAAKEAQAFNEGRIMELEEMVRETMVISRNGKAKEVQIGSIIEVKLIRGSKSEKNIFTIVGGQEANPAEGKISNESPLGQAFLGRKAGDTIEVHTPRGKVKYKIISIK